MMREEALRHRRNGAEEESKAGEADPCKGSAGSEDADRPRQRRERKKGGQQRRLPRRRDDERDERRGRVSLPRRGPHLWAGEQPLGHCDQRRISCAHMLHVHPQPQSSSRVARIKPISRSGGGAQG